MKNLIKGILAFIKFLRAERAEPNRSANLLTKISFYLKGFLSLNIINYKLSKSNYLNYVPDWFRINKLSYVNRGNDLVINDKILFHDYFKGDTRVVPALAFVFDKKIFKANTHQIITVEELVDGLAVNLIFKTARGGGGSGITKINIKKIGSEAAKVKINKMVESSSNFVIQEEVIQDGFSYEVNPSTLNTIRILTMRDPENGQAFIAKAVHRFGTKKSNFVDNWSSGGICVDIDIDKGIFGKGAVKQLDKDGLIFMSVHPDSNIEFEGVTVPNWQHIQQEILKLSEQLFFLKYIGWDVIPFNDGFKVLEANSNSDVNLLQIHGGLLKNPRVKNFYTSEGLNI